MRNYVQLWFGRVVIAPFDTNVWVVQPSLAELEYDLSFNTDPTEVIGPRYFTLDKFNVCNTVRLAYTALMNVQPPTSPGRGANGMNYLDSLTGVCLPGSPRGLAWFDQNGVEHKPTKNERPVSSRRRGQGGGFRITLLNYLIMLLNTWSGVASGPGGKLIPGTGGVPKRWIDWLTLLISHYNRYTPTQIYGFLARVDYSAATFKV